jgi:hypothetical protein
MEGNFLPMNPIKSREGLIEYLKDGLAYASAWSKCIASFRAEIDERHRSYWRGGRVVISFGDPARIPETPEERFERVHREQKEERQFYAEQLRPSMEARCRPILRNGFTMLRELGIVERPDFTPDDTTEAEWLIDRLIAWLAANADAPLKTSGGPEEVACSIPKERRVVLVLKEVAKRYDDVHVDTLRRWIRKGKIAAERIGDSQS